MLKQCIKIKTRQSASKRYRRTKRKKFLYKRPYKSHILEKKSPKQKRNLSTCSIVCKGDAKNINNMLPYLDY